MKLPDSCQPLDDDSARNAFDVVLDGGADDDEVIAFLTAMTRRDETAIEIAAAARAMRARMVAVPAPAGAIDVCGTGGDGSHSLNVSTAVAIVVAACGVTVAKHGNRAASSQAGGADTLEAIGLDLDRASDRAEASLEQLGIAFLFAQRHHPALARLAGVRRAIGRRTIFNLLGPLSNPAGVTSQLIGVARPDYLNVYADAAARLGLDAMLVSGDEPLDEISVSGASSMRWRGASARVAPADFGVAAHPAAAMRGGDARHNAAALVALLDGAPGAYRDAVLVNAAAALVVAGVANDWRDGSERSAAAIDSGTARALLAKWIAF